MHMGACGMHFGPRVIVRKAMRQGYYWSTMHKDAKEEVQKCDSCQIHFAVPKLAKTLMTSIMTPWPFYQWGVDILGPLPQATGRVKFVIVAIDYFTKWIEAKPLARITGKEVIRFVLDNKICRFGLPKIIVTDNGTLGRDRAGWVDELPNVLWAYRTSIKQSNGETPFSLTYGSDAVILAKIERTKQAGLMTNGNWDLNRKDHTESRKHIKMALTSCKLWKTKSTRRHDLPKRLGLKGEVEVHSTGRHDLPKILSLKGESKVHSIGRHDLPKILSLKGKVEVHSTGRHDLPKILSLKGEAEVEGGSPRAVEIVEAAELLGGAGSG
ncbi:reverse transcriptase domain-containing protein [Tanacetum coccineum]